MVDESSIREDENGMEGRLEEDRDGSERFDETIDEEITGNARRKVSEKKPGRGRKERREAGSRTDEERTHEIVSCSLMCFTS